MTDTDNAPVGATRSRKRGDAELGSGIRMACTPATTGERIPHWAASPLPDWVGSLSGRCGEVL